MSRNLWSVIGGWAIAYFMVMSAGYATPVTLRFTNADVDLGLSSFLPVTTEYESRWGIVISNAYRYYDGRDPFSDVPNELRLCAVNPNSEGFCNFGLGSLATAGFNGIGRIDFVNPTSFVSFDWFGFMCCNITTFRALDATGGVIATFSREYPDALNLPVVFGSETMNGAIASFEWTSVFTGDPSLRVANANLANLSYDLLPTSPPIPEPASSALLVLGLATLAGVVARRRRP